MFALARLTALNPFRRRAAAAPVRQEPTLALPAPTPTPTPASCADAASQGCEACDGIDDSAVIAAPPQFLRSCGSTLPVPNLIKRATLDAGPAMFDADVPVEVHAADLTTTLCADVDELTVMRLTDVQRAYHRLCQDNGWVPRPWSHVSELLTDSLHERRTDGGPRKPYRNLPDALGQIRKTRVFLVPPLPAAVVPMPRRSLLRMAA